MSEVAFSLDNPFPGLRAFTENDADRFFGRQHQIDELTEKLTRQQFIAVSGNSGCGKSSLVRAGLLRDLQRQTTDPGATVWRPVIMLPGDKPIASLSKALSAALDLRNGDEARTGLLYGQLKLGGLGLIEVVRQAKLAPRTRVLLVVDQFEELFRLKQADPDEASAFVKLLLNAALDEASLVSVIITLRSDWLGYCADFRGLPEAVNRGLYLVPKLTRDQRKEAIIGPVELRAQRISARLVQRILNDVSDDFDDLPVMQHALTRTWNRWESVCQGSRPIDFEDYEFIGTTKDAISKHAEEATEATQQQPVVEKVFRALTERGPHGEAIRRALAFNQLCDVTGGDQGAVAQVIERFRQPDTAFLRPSQEVPLTDNPIVDISHESLIRQWPKLGEWMKAEAESVEMLERIVEAARLNRANEGSLWSGRTLVRAREWQRPTLAWVQLYLSGDAVATWQLAERFLENSEREYRGNQRQKRLLVGGLCVFAICFVVGLVYLSFLRASQKDEAASNAVANKALLQLDQDPARSAQMALIALDLNRHNANAEFALRQSLTRLENAHTKEIIEPCDQAAESHDGKKNCEPVRDIRYTNDGSRLVVASGKAVTLFDAKDFRQIGPRFDRQANVVEAWLTGGNQVLITKTEDQKVQSQMLGQSTVNPLSCPDNKPVWTVALSGDERHVAIGCHDGEVRVWDVSQPVNQHKEQFVRDITEKVTVTALGFSVEGKFLASGDADGKISVWKLGTRRVWIDHVGTGVNKKPIAHNQNKAIRSIHFYENDSAFLVTAGDDNQAMVWNLNLERRPLTIKEQDEKRYWNLKHERPVSAAKFFPALEGNVPPVFTVSAKIAQRWKNEVNDPKQMRGHDDWVRDANRSPNGELMVTASADGTARIWSTQSGPPIAVLRGHRGQVNRAFFNPEGDLVLTASDDGSVRVWRFRAPRLLATLDHWALGAAFDPAGGRVAIADEKGDACVVTVSESGNCLGKNVKKLDFGNGMLSGMSWSRDAKYLVGTVAGIEMNIPTQLKLLEVENKTKQSAKAALHDALSAVFRVKGDELLTISSKGQLALWDAKKLDAPDLKPMLAFGTEGPGRSLPAISPDGLWIAASNGKDIELWRRAETHKEPRKLVGHRTSVRSLQFSSDSTRLLSASEDRTALIWPLASPDKPIELKGGHTSALYSASFDRTGQWVVTGSADSTIGFWNAKTAQMLALLRWHGEGVNTVEFSPKDGSILSASDDGTVRLARCEACTLPLSELKARALQMSKLSREDERELQLAIKH